MILSPNNSLHGSVHCYPYAPNSMCSERCYPRPSQEVETWIPSPVCHPHFLSGWVKKQLQQKGVLVLSFGAGLSVPSRPGLKCHMEHNRELPQRSSHPREPLQGRGPLYIFAVHGPAPWITRPVIQRSPSPSMDRRPGEDRVPDFWGKKEAPTLFVKALSGTFSSPRALKSELASSSMFWVQRKKFQKLRLRIAEDIYSGRPEAVLQTSETLHPTGFKKKWLLSQSKPVHTDNGPSSKRPQKA